MTFRAAASDFKGMVAHLATYVMTTRVLTSLVILPVFGLVTTLTVGSRGAITNATLGAFLASVPGAIFAVGVLCLLFWMVAAELGGAIIVSARYRLGRPSASYRTVLAYSIKQMPNLLGAGTIPVLGYLVIALPLTGLGMGVSITSGLAIPKFIMSSIEETPLWAAGYAVLMLVLAAVAVLLSYTFPLIMLAGVKAGRAMTMSARMVIKKPQVYLRRYVGPVIGAGVAASVLVALWFGVSLAVLTFTPAESMFGRSFLAFLLLVRQVGALAVAILLTAFTAYRLTVTFYAALPEGSELVQACPELPARTSRRFVDRLAAHPVRLTVVGLVVMAMIAVPLGLVVAQIAEMRADVVVIAHRAGGKAAPENSLSGLRYAIEHKAEQVEVDVQRTRDGGYVLNHDDTFARAAGVKKPSTELTLAEIKEMRLKGTDEAPPELTEFLTAARGRMHVLLELKGATADRRMAREVGAVIDGLGMRDQVTLMSLDYKLVQAIKSDDPGRQVGYVYFLSIGEVSELTGDVIVLEEGEATLARLIALKSAGKKAYVWTINDPETMDRMLVRPIDGIITDHVDMAREAVDRRRVVTSSDVFSGLLLGS